MDSDVEKNKAIVTRFNREAIEEGRLAAFDELIDDSFINHTAPAGIPFLQKRRWNIPVIYNRM